MKSKPVQRMEDELGWLQMGLERLSQRPSDLADLNRTVLEASIENNRTILHCIEEGLPFISSIYCYAPEIYTAMNLPWYSFYGTRQTMSPPAIIQMDVEGCDSLDLPSDLCTAIRLAAYYVEADLCPPPTAAIAMITPCDGLQMLQQMVMTNEKWKNVPMFGPDPPYMEGERALDYYLTEYRQMVDFLKEHTGRRLNVDRLREVIEESNKQYELWAEYNELRRALPCPHGYSMGVQAFNMVQMLLPGDPRCTSWLRQLVNNAEQRVREKRGSVDNERIRLLWNDVRPFWINAFAGWLEREWGAVIVMDMYTYNPYTLIDTSTEESMFRGLAKRGLYDAPMVRQERGTADEFINDIVRIVRDYSIDCVVWPGHMGHKAMAAEVGIGREVCRDLGVPFLELSMDLFDSRYTTPDEIKGRISQFFVAMDLG